METFRENQGFNLDWKKAEANHVCDAAQKPAKHKSEKNTQACSSKSKEAREG